MARRTCSSVTTGEGSRENKGAPRSRYRRAPRAPAEVPAAAAPVKPGAATRESPHASAAPTTAPPLPAHRLSTELPWLGAAEPRRRARKCGQGRAPARALSGAPGRRAVSDRAESGGRRSSGARPAQRAGCLLGGTIGTFDDLFERIAGGDPGRRPVTSGAQRALVAASAAHGAVGEELAASARFAGFTDALLAAFSDLEGGLRRARRPRGRPRRPARGLPRRARPARSLGPRPAPAQRVQPTAGRARRLVGRAGVRVRVRGSDGDGMVAARGVGRACRRARLASLRARPGRVRVALAHRRRPLPARDGSHRRVAAAIGGVRRPRPRPSRAGALRTCGAAAADVAARCASWRERACGARSSSSPTRCSPRSATARRPSEIALVLPSIERGRETLETVFASFEIPVAVECPPPFRRHPARARARFAASVRVDRRGTARALFVPAHSLLGDPAPRRRLRRGAPPGPGDRHPAAGRGGDRAAARGSARGAPRSARRRVAARRRADRDRIDDARRLRRRGTAHRRPGPARPCDVRRGDRPARRARRPRGARHRARTARRDRRTPAPRGSRRADRSAGPRGRPRSPAGPDAPVRHRLRPRARGGLAAAPRPQLAVPRRRRPERARCAARAPRSREPRPVSLLHRLHPRHPPAVSRPAGGDRRRLAARGKPLLARRRGCLRPRGRGARNHAAAALAPHLADRGGTDRARAAAGARPPLGGRRVGPPRDGAREGERLDAPARSRPKRLHA